MGHISAAGEPLVRTRGVMLKAEGIILICPKCRADVPLAGDLLNAMKVLLFAKSRTDRRS